MLLKTILQVQTLKKIFDHGYQRWLTHRSVDHPNQLVANPGDDSTDILGLAFEVAYGQLRNLEPDWSLSVNGDRGYDFIDCGERINVKGTTRGNGRLMVPDWTNNYPDYWALMTCGDWQRDKTKIRDTEFRLAGYYPGLDLLKVPLRDFGYGPTYAVEQSSLILPPELAS